MIFDMVGWSVAGQYLLCSTKQLKAYSLHELPVYVENGDKDLPVNLHNLCFDIAVGKGNLDHRDIYDFFMTAYDNKLPINVFLW